MKKIFTGIVLLSIIFLTGCEFNKTERDVNTSEPSMFVVIEETSSWDVMYHRDTKVMYLYTTYGGFRPLINADGTPMIYETEDN